MLTECHWSILVLILDKHKYGDAGTTPAQGITNCACFFHCEVQGVVFVNNTLFSKCISEFLKSKCLLAYISVLLFKNVNIQ